MDARHRDLRDMIARNQFREDLYYRLNGITLELPSLARRRDVESLIRKCIASEQQRGHMTAVATQLRISRNTLYRKIKRHGKSLRHGIGERTA
jgi:transcriptional regulator of acetoin/glycerol metabolism